MEDRAEAKDLEHEGSMDRMKTITGCSSRQGTTLEGGERHQYKIGEIDKEGRPCCRPCHFLLSEHAPVLKLPTWSAVALLQLLDRFSNTEWSVFEHQDLDTHREAVLDYINFCVGNVTVNKRTGVPRKGAQSLY